MVCFSDLSSELVLFIAEKLEHEGDFNRLSRASRSLYSLLNRHLYSRHVSLHGSWALTWATKHDRVGTAKRLLAAGADVLARTNDLLPVPPIIVAARHGSLAMMKLLCETDGVDPDWYENRTIPALNWAAEAGKDDIVRLLLDDPRVDPGRLDWTGSNPLHYAAGECHASVVALLLRDPRISPATADNEGLTPFLCAAWALGDNAGAIRLLLADPRVNPAEVDANGSTAIILASEAGNVANLKVLIGAGPDVNGQNIEGLTALFYAVTKESIDVLRLLLAAPGIDPNIQDLEGRTAITQAVEHGTVDMVRLLLADERVDANAKTDDGWTVLMSTIMLGEVDCVRELLLHPQIDINSIGQEDASALLFAISEDHTEVVRADWPPVVSAVVQANEDVIRMLCEDGRFSIRARDAINGRTPISWAAKHGALDIVKILAEYRHRPGGLGLLEEDGAGIAALEYGIISGNQELASLLEEYEAEEREALGL